MPRSFDEFLLNVRFADVLDVAIVTLLLYIGLGWLRRRAARAVVVGVVVVGLVYVLARELKMYLVLDIFRAGFTLLLFSLVVVYREDIRHALERVSFGWPFVRSGVAPPSQEFRSTLVESVMAMAERSMGALIVLPGRHSLERHVRGGVLVEGRLSLPLVLSVFHHDTPGHDGAAVIESERLDRIGVHLPLSTNLGAVGPGGTRHTAALGLAERCDALVIVVSEERGTVSVAQQGRLEVIPKAAELERRIADFYIGETRTAAGQRRAPVGRAMLSFLGCLGVALVLWLSFAFRVERISRSFAAVPVEIRNLPEAGWSVESVEPTTVDLTLVGPERAFESLKPDLRVSIDLSRPTEGDQDFAITEKSLSLPEQVTLGSVAIPPIRIRAMRVGRESLPVTVTTKGTLPSGLELVDTRTNPKAIAVRISEAAREWNRELRTEPVDLGDVTRTETRQVGLVLPKGVQFVNPASATVEVTLEVRAVQPNTKPNVE